MTKDSKGKPIGWLKGVLSTYNETDDVDYAQQVLEIPKVIDPIPLEEFEQAENNSNADSTPKSKLQFLKDNQDKVSLDVVVAVENLLNDRQLTIFRNKGLEEQLHNANEVIIRLKNEHAKKEQTILDKDREIRNLESKLTSKQMSYDQLLEDYKDFQNTSNNGFENLKYQLEKEVNKYSKLDEEFTKYQYQTMQKIKELEETIRDLEVENQNITAQYQAMAEEKKQLLQTFSDFSERMSGSFGQLEKRVPHSTPE